MSEMASLMEKLAVREGFNDTFLPEIRIFKGSNQAEIIPFTYDQGLFFVGRGAERVHFENEVYDYNQSNYLALSVPISAVGEVLESKNGPMLAMAVDFNLTLLSAILLKLTEEDLMSAVTPAPAKGLYVSSRTPEISEAVLRLLRVLQSPMEAKVIGPLLLEELLFRVLVGESGGVLLALTDKSSHLAKVDRALKHMHATYRQKIDVETLASMANMSPSVFHRVFKHLTAKSPIQYLKSLRLSKARELLAARGCSVNEAAHQVGYESVSQFSREFKRAYGMTPKDTKSQQVLQPAR